MADVVSSRTLHDAERNVVMQFTNRSDGSGEAAVKKVDVSALNPNSNGQACSQVRIMQIWFSTVGMSVELLWDATTDDLAWAMQENLVDSFDFRNVGGLKNPETSGFSGDLMLTTIGHTNADTYNITIAMRKEY